MKWSGETYRKYRERISKEPQRKFAILPTQLQCGSWVWLQHFFWFRDLDSLDYQKVCFETQEQCQQYIDKDESFQRLL